eukprot:11970696-Alexandrium_andersonii.AAC.1
MTPFAPAQRTKLRSPTAMTQTPTQMAVLPRRARSPRTRLCRFAGASKRSSSRWLAGCSLALPQQ